MTQSKAQLCQQGTCKMCKNTELICVFAAMTYVTFHHLELFVLFLPIYSTNVDHEMEIYEMILIYHYIHLVYLYI